MNKNVWKIKPWARDVAAEEGKEKNIAPVASDFYDTNSGKNAAWGSTKDKAPSIQSLKNSSKYFDELFGSFKLGGAIRKRSVASRQTSIKGGEDQSLQNPGPKSLLGGDGEGDDDSSDGSQKNLSLKRTPQSSDGALNVTTRKAAAADRRKLLIRRQSWSSNRNFNKSNHSSEGKTSTGKTMSRKKKKKVGDKKDESESEQRVVRRRKKRPSNEKTTGGSGKPPRKRSVSPKPRRDSNTAEGGEKPRRNRSTSPSAGKGGKKTRRARSTSPKPGRGRKLRSLSPSPMVDVKKKRKDAMVRRNSWNAARSSADKSGTQEDETPSPTDSPQRKSPRTTTKKRVVKPKDETKTRKTVAGDIARRQAESDETHQSALKMGFKKARQISTAITKRIKNDKFEKAEILKLQQQLLRAINEVEKLTEENKEKQTESSQQDEASQAESSVAATTQTEISQTATSQTATSTQTELSQMEISQMETEISDLNTMLAASAKENRELHDQLEEVGVSASESKEKLIEASLEIEDLYEEKQAIATRLNDRDEEIDRLRTELNILQGKNLYSSEGARMSDFHDLDSIVKSKQLLIDELTEDVKKKDAQIRAMEEQIYDGKNDRATQEVIQANVEMESLKSKQREERLESAIEMERKDALITSLQEKLDRAEENHREAIATTATLHQDLDFNREKLRDALQKVENSSDIEKEMEDLRTRAQDAETVNIGLQAAIDKWTDKCFEWKAKTEDLQAQIISLSPKSRW